MCHRSGRTTLRRTGPTSSARSAGLLALLLIAGCAASPDPSPPSPEAAAGIEAMLHASADAWNRGDLDGFIGDYAADATFVTSEGLLRGADRIRRMYAEGYWAGGAPEDALRFELLDTRVTGPASATTFGRYVLYDRASGRTTASGVFTLVLERVGGAWKILHDHSSADAQD